MTKKTHGPSWQDVVSVRGLSLGQMLTIASCLEDDLIEWMSDSHKWDEPERMWVRFTYNFYLLSMVIYPAFYEWNEKSTGAWK